MRGAAVIGLALLALAALPPLSLAQAAPPQERAARFRRVVRSAASPDVRKAALLELGALDHHAVIEALLEEGFASKNEALREEAIRYGAAQTLPFWRTCLIQQACRARDPLVREASARILAPEVRQAHAAALLAMVEDRDPEVRVTVLWGLGLQGEAKAQPKVEACAKDKVAAVRTAAARALGDLRLPASVPVLLELAEDKSWEVRAAALDALGWLRVADPVVPFLVERLSREEGRLRDDVLQALQHITAAELGADPDLWQSWWEAYVQRGKPELPAPARHYTRFGEVAGGLPAEPDQAPPDPTATGVPTLFGIPSTSLQVTFVLDTSASMAEPSRGVRPGQGETRPGGESWPRSTRLALAQEETCGLIERLPSGAVFNVVTFGTEAEAWRPRAVAATPGNVREALEHVSARKPSGRTATFDALALAMGADRGHLAQARWEPVITGPKHPSTPDTIFLVSDGEPDEGTIPFPDDTLREVARLNRVRRIVIHAVGLGSFRQDSFLKLLAAGNGGRHVQIGD